MRNFELPDQSITDPTVDACTEASTVLRSMLNREIQSAIGYRSSIHVECINGVVILSGYFANKNDKHTALRKAISNPGVYKVINNAN